MPWLFRLILLTALSPLVLVAQVNGTYEKGPPVASDNVIDRHVRNDLKILKIKPANQCSDDVFLRRIYLDLVGGLPTLKEQMAFSADSRTDKRERVVDDLMARDAFVDYWTMKWCDLLRVKAEFPINLWPNGVQAYHRWIQDAVRTNMPYDRFARELLTSSGSNFREAPVNFYRAAQGRKPEDLASIVALTFMGTRFDKWPEERQRDMAVFFSRVAFKGTSEWKEQVVYLDPTPVEARAAVFPDGTKTTLLPTADPRKVFADWLISADNPEFTETLVNRLWYWLMGRGIVHEPDDRRKDNPPSNPMLLTALQKELVASKYDLRHVIKLIVLSQTYQQSPIPQSDSPKAEAHFAHYPIHPIEAEVLVDSLTYLFGGGENYFSQIPEPFTFIPKSHGAVALADGSITSQLLETFGRPSRDTGLATERGRAPTTAQKLFLLNSQEIQQALRRNRRLKELVFSKRKNRSKVDPVTAVYRLVLCRAPTDTERRLIRKHAKTVKLSRRDTAMDLVWALLNTKEFLYKH